MNDGIERRLFGNIDARGADAIRAFAGVDQTAWHSSFENLFKYLDIQKLRTPKGLAWLRSQYPELSQNELMLEMQSIRMLNVTTWTTGVREIVSAEYSPTKFILTDHPVTVYNHAVSPRDGRNDFPSDPSIALNGSQTIYPLGPDHCLILTNLEYAQDPSVNPLDKRTFARSFQQAMVSTINFIRTRHLTEEQVIEVNFISARRRCSAWSTVMRPSPQCARGRAGRERGGSGSVAAHARSVSATLQAWNGQPPGSNGASPSKTSAMLPRPASGT